MESWRAAFAQAGPYTFIDQTFTHAHGTGTFVLLSWRQVEQQSRLPRLDPPDYKDRIQQWMEIRFNDPAGSIPALVGLGLEDNRFLIIEPTGLVWYLRRNE